VGGRDAKLAVLEWDPEHSTLRPSSLHYFESDPALRGRCTVFARPPLARSDPQVHLGRANLRDGRGKDIWS
jgi:hypothetical protein